MGRALRAAFGAKALAQGLGLSLAGDDRDIHHVPAPGDPLADGLCFARAMAYAADMQPGAVVITSEGELADAAMARGAAVLVSANPRLDFARALVALDHEVGFRWSDDEPEVHPTAQVGRNVVLGRGVRIGAHTRILHNVVIGDEVVIGERCLIKSCSVIGEPGFGFERDDSGAPVRILHLGGVRIHDDVEIGSLNTVVRATLGDTVVHSGVKTDDHVHIAHNCSIGRNTLLTACAELSGGVEIGESVWVAPNASLMNKIRIGDHALIGLGAVVRKDVPAHDVVAGNPARSVKRS